MAISSPPVASSGSAESSRAAIAWPTRRVDHVVVEGWHGSADLGGGGAQRGLARLRIGVGGDLVADVVACFAVEVGGEGVVVEWGW